MKWADQRSTSPNVIDSPQCSLLLWPAPSLQLVKYHTHSPTLSLPSKPRYECDARWSVKKGSFCHHPTWCENLVHPYPIFRFNTETSTRDTILQFTYSFALLPPIANCAAEDGMILIHFATRFEFHFFLHYNHCGQTSPRGCSTATLFLTECHMYQLKTHQYDMRCHPFCTSDQSKSAQLFVVFRIHVQHDLHVQPIPRFKA